MPSPSKTLHLRRDMRAITIDGLTFSLMVGAGEQCFIAFALALGMGEALGGLLASVPLLVGAVLQLVTPYGVRLFRSHRTWVLCAVATQAVCFIPLTIAAFAGRIPTLAMFAVVSFYWAGGLAAGGAWNTWIATLIPARVRARFFAQRTRVMQVGLLLGMLIAGVVLQNGKRWSFEVQAFGILFIVAGAARLLSVRLLSTQSEPHPLPENTRAVAIGEWLRRLQHSADGRLLVYMLAVQTAAFVAAPYFTPFMLKQLHLEYGAFVTLLAVSFAAKIITMPLLGRLAKEYGARALLWVGGVAIVPLAALWIGALDASFWYLLVVQFLAGTAWGAYELGTFLFQYEMIRQEERTSMLTTFNLANAAALTGGSMIGWAVLTALEEAPLGYYLVYGGSTVLRAAALLLLLRVGRLAPATSTLQPRATP